MAFSQLSAKKPVAIMTSELSHAVADAKAKYIMRKRKMAN